MSDLYLKLLISYYPLVTGNPLDQIEIKTEEDFRKVFKIVEGFPSGLAVGCLWVANENGVSAILIYENQAKERCDHLLWWAGQQPRKWFSICIYQNKKSYGIALMPDLKRSCARHKFITSEFKFNYDKTLILFSPPCALCPTSVSYDQVKEHLNPKKLKVGFVNKNDINFENLNKVEEKIYWVGELSRNDSEESTKFLIGGLENMREETKNTI